MKINVFEGARRIALTFYVIISIIALFLIFGNSPLVERKYSIPFPGAYPEIFTGDCIEENGSSLYSYGKTPKGHSYSAEVCLLPMWFDQREGMKKLLIPYATHGDTTYGNVKTSEEVMRYATHVRENLNISKNEINNIDSSFNEQYISGCAKGIGIFLISSLIYWSFVWITGWIARGFAGIPRGKDKRPDDA